MVPFLLPAMLLAAQGPAFGPGSPAPKIEVKTWVKGDPIKALEADKTYVVEFWATWCGPCIETIPHLTDLAKKYKSVRFIGLSILEDNDKGQVQAFVKQMGDKMDYTVGYSGNRDAMAASWFAPANQTGIPTAFIVKNNAIQWIGHPIGLDKPLGELSQGTFDIGAARKEFEAGLRSRAKSLELQKALANCEAQYEAGETAKAKADLAKLEENAEAKDRAAEIRFRWLALEDPTAWKTVARGRMDSGRSGRNTLCFFINENAEKAPALCKWLLAELTSGRYESDWYPWLNGGRMHLKLKEYAAGLECTAKARAVILDFQKSNPDAPKGNALDVIQALEDEIRKQKGG